MRATQSPDAIDARFVLRVYAGITIAAGLATYAWPHWVLPDAALPAATPANPWSVARIAAALVAASGACAAGLATLADPLSRVRALYALAAVRGSGFFGPVGV